MIIYVYVYDICIYMYIIDYIYMSYVCIYLTAKIHVNPVFLNGFCAHQRAEPVPCPNTTWSDALGLAYLDNTWQDSLAGRGATTGLQGRKTFVDNWNPPRNGMVWSAGYTCEENKHKSHWCHCSEHNKWTILVTAWEVDGPAFKRLERLRNLRRFCGKSSARDSYGAGGACSGAASSCCDAKGTQMVGQDWFLDAPAGDFYRIARAFWKNRTDKEFIHIRPLLLTDWGSQGPTVYPNDLTTLQYFSTTMPQCRFLNKGTSSGTSWPKLSRDVMLSTRHSQEKAKLESDLKNAEMKLLVLYEETHPWGHLDGPAAASCSLVCIGSPKGTSWDHVWWLNPNCSPNLRFKSQLFHHFRRYPMFKPFSMVKLVKL